MKAPWFRSTFTIALGQALPVIYTCLNDFTQWLRQRFAGLSGDTK